VTLDLMDQLALREYRVQLAPQDSLDPSVASVLLALKEQLDQRVRRVPPDRRVHPDQEEAWDLLVELELPVRLVRKVRLEVTVILASQDPVDQLVFRVTRGPLAETDHLGSRGHRGLLDR